MRLDGKCYLFNPKERKARIRRRRRGLGVIAGTDVDYCIMLTAPKK